MIYIKKARSVFRVLLLILTAFVGVGAVAGSGGMFYDPSGHFMGMDILLPYFEKMPFPFLFENYIFAGISLLIVNGISNLTAFVLILKNKKSGYVLGFVFGITLMLWICIQFWLFAPMVAFLDVLFFGIGAAQFLVGYLAFVYDRQYRFQQAAVKEPLPEVSDNRVAVVYFSRMGYTRRLAVEEAKKRHCILIELTSTEQTAGILGFWWCGRFGMHGWPMPLTPIEEDFSRFDTVVLFSPTWVFALCGPVRDFLKTYGDQLKRVELTVLHFNPGPCRFIYKAAQEALGNRLVAVHSVVCHFGKTKEIE